MAGRQPALLFVTQHFPPEEIGSAPLCGEFAVWLGDHGYEPHVLTSQPQYPARERFSEFRAKRIKRQTYCGVTVDRLNAWAPQTRSTWRRILAELHFFSLGALALVLRRVRRTRLVLSQGPSIFSVALGVLATRRGGRHVVWLHDIQSGLAQGLQMARRGWLLGAMRLQERIVLNRASVIAVLTSEMRAELRRLGVVRPIEVMPLWVDADAIRPLARTGGPATILYSGNLGRKQGLWQLLDLAAELQRRETAVQLIVRGAGSAGAEIEAEIRRRALANVHLQPLLPREQLAEGLADGDIHLVPQIPDIADFAIPSKIFNIMAAGRPLIATALPDTSLWRLQAASDAFVCVPPNDATALADAVIRLLENDAERRRLGAAGRQFILAHHERNQVLRSFANLIDDSAATRTRNEPRRGMVVFEPDRHGHPLEWLQHLIRFAAQQAKLQRLHFVVAPELQAVLAAEVPPHLQDTISVTALTAAERRYCCHGALAVSGFARWWTMRRYLQRTRSDRGCFLSLDHLSLPLALGFGGGGCRLGGILFRPSVHYRQFGRYRPTLRERLRDLRKAVLYRRMLANRALDNVLSLDPFFPNFAARRYRHGAKVVALPDPVYRQILQPSSCRDEPGEAGRVKFLLFGHITERKGVFVLLDSLRGIRSTTAARIHVVLAGSIDEGIRAEVLRRVAQVQTAQPDLLLDVDDRRLPGGELFALIQASDVVLAPYQRFVGSSGVLLWAASAGKPVLTQDFGLIGRLARDHRLGVTADTSDSAAVAAALERIVASGGASRLIDQAAAAEFVAERSPERFAAEIFGRLDADEQSRDASA